MADHTYVNVSVPRLDGRAKVTGAAVYACDLTLPGMLHGKVVRSTTAHGRILDIDAGEARREPGVRAVITSQDLHGLFPRFGHILADHPILAIGKVRYWGEPVALVVADTAQAAVDGARLVRVRYEMLPPLMTPEQALDPDAPLLHEETYQTGDEAFQEALPEDNRKNIAHRVDLGWGDVDAALASAHVVVETTTHYPMLYAYAMEPYNALANYTDEQLLVYSTAQHPFMVQQDLARIFSLPLARVRVIAPFVGGGYGSKSYTKIEPLASVGSWYTRRPVKVVLDVEESIYTTRADAARVSVRSAFDCDGHILARDFEIELDSGAYADNSPLVLAKATHRCIGPYHIPNLRVRARSVYTTTPPASSYRGFGAPQGVLAGETNIDQAAEKLGIDPAEMRRRNLLEPGAEVLPGKRPLDADLKADLDLVTTTLNWKPDESKPWSGIGFSCSASDAGAFPVSTGLVKIQSDGSVIVMSGSAEMGQGSHTVLCQIAAEELGVPLERIRVLQSDTSATSYERTTGASRTTTLGGLSLINACADARAKLHKMAAELWGCEAEQIQALPGAAASPDGKTLTFSQIIRGWFGGDAGEVIGSGAVRKSGALSKMPPFWEIGVVGVEVAVDADTGKIAVLHLVTVGDVGFAINPALVEGQDLGAATQGLGGALYEELVFDGPHPVNPNIVEYRVPRITDMPRRITTLLAQRQDGVGPYGGKGGGEGSLNPIGSAIASAVARAIGRWPNRLPLTPERVWRLMNDLPDEE
jgi:CO/xanthine dehydrogenase Mo-binding subunit